MRIRDKPFNDSESYDNNKERQKMKRRTSFMSRDAIAAEFKRKDDEDRRQNKRIDILEKNFEQMHNIASSVEILAQNMKSMCEEQKKQGERIDKLESAPGESWNKIKTGILSAIAGAVGTGIVAAIMNYM